MEAQQQQPRKFVLRTTCLKNGGFRNYIPLPPQSVFQHAYWVLGSELDVKVKRKQTFFNRETEWMRLPVYLTTNKGLLFIYTTARTGYILRVPSALRLQFEGNKKLVKNRANSAGGYVVAANGGEANETTNFVYTASLTLHFMFGELHIRFSKDDNLRPWRAILLAAHQSETGLAKIGETVANEINPAVSLESVVSTKSVVPNKDGKKQADEIIVHRHPREATFETVIDETGRNVNSLPESTEQTTSSESSVNSAASKNSQQLSNASSLNDSTTMRARTPSSPWNNEYEPRHRLQHKDRKIHYDAEVIDFSREVMTNPDKPSSNPQTSDLGTSEVDVSCKDINQFNASTTSVHTGILNLSPIHSDVNRSSRSSLASCGSNPFFEDDYSNQCKVMDGQHMGVSGGRPMQKTRADSLKLQAPTHQIQKVTFADAASNSDDHPTPRRASFPRAAHPKPSPIAIGGNGKRSQVMEFWRKKETETGAPPIQIKSPPLSATKAAVQPIKPAPAQVKRVHFKEETLQKHSSGKVLNSPTKFYANVDEEEASPVGPSKSAQIQSESYI